MPLHVSSTVVLIIWRSKFCYTASGIITPIGGRPVHWWPPKEWDDTRCCTTQFDLLMMSTAVFETCRGI